MLFEEFFKKKKINLATLEQGQPDLFSEFKEHYAQMGEKSFDHTKKYWFNKLRHEYPLPVEVKEEKVRLENPIAEQTVADALTEPTPQGELDKLGFKPKFKAGTTPVPKPAENAPLPQTTDQAKQEPAEAPATSKPAAEPVKMGFKPRFKAGVTKPAEEVTPTPASEATNDNSTSPAAQPAKLGFKPKFKAGVTGKPVNENSIPVESSTESNSAITDTETAKENASVDAATDKPASTTVKPGFKPRFKAGITTSKPVEEKPANIALENTTADTEDKPAIDVAVESVEQPTTPKLGFKPRFKAGITTTKPTEEKPAESISESSKETTEEASTEVSSNEDEKPEAPAAPKLGFKPRFKAGVTTTKSAPSEEEKTKETAQPTEAVTPAPKAEESTAPAPTTPPAKQPYKPRFNPGMMKPKPPAEGDKE
ncbi:hypothetical protein [Mucilaginibacter aquatilis]|uniref:Uncharacterized protein n=1 Tax=Mucilaginibacter aquatilis TaxID=1517760 RepID=A0A6I4IAJ4_9SPHI|nr:hypothetical protein [Mucilaginibacter aquatilis]MVN92195.1 hypothetical protein [Mucilaginibacter aquatilis]